MSHIYFSFPRFYSMLKTYIRCLRHPPLEMDLKNLCTKFHPYTFILNESLYSMISSFVIISITVLCLFSRDSYQYYSMLNWFFEVIKWQHFTLTQQMSVVKGRA